MTDEKREVRAIVRTYKDNDGNDKNVYTTVGTAWVSEHGSKISIQLETIPVTPEWNGKLYINKPYEPKDSRPIAQHQVLDEAHKDVVIDDLDDRPIKDQLSEIPF